MPRRCASSGDAIARVLAADTVASLQAPLGDLGVPWTVELRTGDTTAAQRAKQFQQLPTALVTTPESLTLMLARQSPKSFCRGFDWLSWTSGTNLMSTKRGVQAELALARLRMISPNVRTWGISATLGNLEGTDTLGGMAPKRESVLVKGALDKEIVIDSILPKKIDRFPGPATSAPR